MLTAPRSSSGPFLYLTPDPSAVPDPSSWLTNTGDPPQWWAMSTHLELIAPHCRPRSRFERSYLHLEEILGLHARLPG